MGLQGVQSHPQRENFVLFFVEKNNKLGQELKNYKPFQQQNEADKIFWISMN